MAKVSAVLILLLVVFGAVIMTTQSSRWKQTSGRQLFKEGREQVCTGDYAAGRATLEGYLGEYGSGEFASRAQFFVAKSYVGEGDFAAAETAFQATIDGYPESLEAHKSRFKLAMLELMRGDREAARAAFAALAARKDGPFTPEATAMAAWLAQDGAVPAPVDPTAAD